GFLRTTRRKADVGVPRENSRLRRRVLPQPGSRRAPVAEIDRRNALVVKADALPGASDVVARHGDAAGHLPRDQATRQRQGGDADGAAGARDRRKRERPDDRDQRPGEPLVAGRVDREHEDVGGGVETEQHAVAPATEPPSRDGGGDDRESEK